MNTPKLVAMLALAMVLLAPAVAAQAENPGEKANSLIRTIVEEGVQPIVGGLLAAVAIFGGFRLMTAGDDPIKRKGAIALLVGGICGALLVFLGPGIADWISEKGQAA
jgi:hypothetical protein